MKPIYREAIECYADQVKHWTEQFTQAVENDDAEAVLKAAQKVAQYITHQNTVKERIAQLYK